MKNEIHIKSKERLISKLDEGLKDIKGIDYQLNILSYLNIGKLKLEDILDKNIKKELQEYIRDDALTLYVYDSLTDEIIENPLFEKNNKSKELYKISDIIDTSTLANKVINSIENIPLKLDFAFNLGNLFFEHIDKGLQISNELLLINDVEWLNDTFNLKNPNENRNKIIEKSNNPLQIPLSPTWEEGNTYLLINLNGFVSNTAKTNTTLNAENKYKSFLGLMIANEFLRFSFSPGKNFKNQYYTFKENIIYSKNQLDDDFSKGLSRLTLNIGLAGIIDFKKVDQTLSFLNKLFQNGEEYEKLRNACCWLFDSYCGENELLSFVQSTITLEILLGDKSESDKTGLGSLLKNRCAYLLGKTNKERNNILDEFEEIYKTRSKIVHRGHPKLTMKEKNLLHKVRSLAKQVIIKELELL